MLIGKKEFIAGVLMATLAMGTATEVSSLYATNSRFSSEVEFSQKIGLFDSENLSSKTLKSNIAEIAFYRGLNLVLCDKGVVTGFDIKKLEEIGITSTDNPMGSLTRKKAAETILRAVMYASNQGMVDIPKGQKMFFKDWLPEAKYNEVMAFAVDKGVLKGVGSGNFKPDRKVTVKEALVFLKRLYELETAAPKAAIGNDSAVAPKAISGEREILIEPDVNKFFKDIGSNNPMNEPIKRLINAGAFDIANLNHEMNLTKSISVQDLGQICKGMINKAGKADTIVKITELQKGIKPYEAADRNLLAKMGAVMTEVYPHKDYSIIANYVDVKQGTPVDSALTTLSKAGVRMGYADNTFKGEEKVSRYEVMGLLNTIVGDNVSTRLKIKATPKAQLAKSATDNTKVVGFDDENEDFGERIRKRREQFHKIINRQSTKK